MELLRKGSKLGAYEETNSFSYCDDPNGYFCNKYNWSCRRLCELVIGPVM